MYNLVLTIENKKLKVSVSDFIDSRNLFVYQLLKQYVME